MHRSVLGGLLVVLVVSAVGVGGVAQAADPSAVADGSEQVATGAVDTDNFESTTFELTVHENGDATWTSRYERQLAPNESAEFEEFVEEFEEDDEGELFVRFTEQAHALTDRGAEHTDREMEASNFNRSAGIDYRPNRMGYVEMSFTWSGFAPVEDGTIIVGDVFAGGLYIEDDQTFVVQSGDGLTFVSVQPDGQYVGESIEEASSVSWNGQRDFPDGQPRIVLEPSDGGASAVPTSWLLAAVLVVLVLGAGFVWHRSDESTGSTTASTSPVGSAESSSTGGRSIDEPEAVASEELLSDEDRVVALIRENGGRMKQVDIVDETGWSKSKVSMLLSDMDEEGTISKLRVGRENIISLEGHEPEATRSPFEN